MISFATKKTNYFTHHLLTWTHEHLSDSHMGHFTLQQSGNFGSKSFSNESKWQMQLIHGDSLSIWLNISYCLTFKASSTECHLIPELFL